MTAIVLATRNRGKIDELRRLMGNLSLEIHTVEDFPDGPHVEESAPTLEENALLKARAWHDHTGLPALADDTGLEVEALDGAPGVHSARYAGPDCDARQNRLLLLAELACLSNPSRSARFRTVVAFVDVEETTFEGTCSGMITQSESGLGGFGYDSIFQPEGEGRTFAEMSADEKNAVSHRALAMAKAADFLKRKLSDNR